MIVIVCLPCSSAIRVMPGNVANASSVQDLDALVGRRSDFWPDQFPCPSCGKPSTGMLEREADARVLGLMALRDLTPQEAFAAFNGLGFPDERKCSLEEVQALLREQPVRRVSGTDVVGAARTIIDFLELWDGTKVYFGAGAEGAVIYRITRPVSYTQKALGSSA
jgi:hypothetical protein